MGTYGVDRSGGAGGSGATQNYTPVTDVFDGDGTTVAFTLTVAPGSASALVARVSGVVQTPGVDFTVSSNVITFTTAPASGTDNIVVQNFGVAWSVATVAGSAITGLTSDLVSYTPSGSGASAAPTTVQNALTRAFALIPMNGLTFFDTFSRADTAAGSLGTSESGHAWDVRGPYVASYPLPASSYGQITDGIFVGNPAATAIYATQTFAETVTRIGARFSWASSTGSLTSSVTLIISANSNFISDMVHFTIGRTGWNLQIREGGGSFVTILSGTPAATIAADGKLHTAELSINGRSATVNVDGEIDSIYDERLPDNIGKYCVWELFYNSSPALDLPRIHAAWAGCAPLDEYFGNAKHIYASGTTEFQGTLSGVAGAINCVGTTGVVGTITSLAHASATGGFRRARMRVLNHLGTSGWIWTNIGDGNNNLVWSHLKAGVETTTLGFYEQGLAFSKIQNSITAFATGGQASATALTGQLCRVTTCATNGDSVKLPAATGTGLGILVINDGAASCDVFPSTGGAIDALGTNNAYAVAAGGRAWFYDVASNVWSAVA